MASVMQLDILSPDAYVFTSENVSYVGAKTTGGGVGIMPRHATMVATLESAPLKYRDEQGTAHYLFVDGGFLEVNENKVTILSVAAETAEGIDAVQAQADLERARVKIDNPKAGVDADEALKNFKRAQARLETVRLAGVRE